MFIKDVRQNKILNNASSLKQGFTILELVMTVLVIGLIFSITVRSIDSLDVAKVKGDLARIKTIISATSMHQAMYGEMPIDAEKVKELLLEKQLVKLIDFDLKYYHTKITFVECIPGYVDYTKIISGFWDTTGGVFAYTPSLVTDHSLSYGLCISTTETVPGAIIPPNTSKLPVIAAGIICGFETSFDDGDARTGLGRAAAMFTQTPLAQVEDALFKNPTTNAYFETYSPPGGYSCMDLLNEFNPYNYGILALKVAI